MNNNLAATQKLPSVKLDELVVQIRRNVNQNFLTLGALLYVIREEKRYEEMGWETFTEYLEDREYSRATAYKAIFAFEYYQHRLSLSPDKIERIGIEKLSIIRPVVDEDPPGWIGKAEALSTKDLRYEVKRVTQGEEPDHELLTDLTNLMMPEIEKVVAIVPPDFWAKTYVREPAPGVLECILRISINEKENDE